MLDLLYFGQSISNLAVHGYRTRMNGNEILDRSTPLYRVTGTRDLDEARRLLLEQRSWAGIGVDMRGSGAEIFLTYANGKKCPLLAFILEDFMELEKTRNALGLRDLLVGRREKGRKIVSVSPHLEENIKALIKMVSWRK